MNKIGVPLFVVPFFIFLLLSSCATRINGVLSAEGQADLQVSVALEPRMTAFIQRTSVAAGAQSGAALLDGPALSASMLAAPGVAAASLANTTPSAVQGPVSISRLGDFLAFGDGRAREFVSFEQNGAQGGKCVISLSRDSGTDVLAFISPEIVDYLTMLMAPVATGESLSKTEYLALVGSVYGKAIADEIAKSIIAASLTFPGQVQSVSGGTFSGTKAEFAIPLLDVLVLENPLYFEVTWK